MEAALQERNQERNQAVALEAFETLFKSGQPMFGCTFPQEKEHK